MLQATKNKVFSLSEKAVLNLPSYAKNAVVNTSVHSILQILFFPTLFSLLPYGNYTHTKEEILKVTALQESTAQTKNRLVRLHSATILETLVG